MDNFYKQFLKAEIARQNEISTGMVLLDRAYKLPLHSFLLFRGTSGAGTTALLLETISQLTSLDRVVIYLDTYGSALSHRLKGINKDRLVIFRPWGMSPREIFQGLKILASAISDPIFIFDNLYFYEKDWKDKDWNFSEFVRTIREEIPGATIIASQRKDPTTSLWSVIVDIDKVQNQYEESEDGTHSMMAHFAKISGPKGTSVVFIEHFTGRVSKAFEHVRLEIENGTKVPTSMFEFEDIKVQGAWKLVYEIGRKHLNELSNDEM